MLTVQGLITKPSHFYIHLSKIVYISIVTVVLRCGCPQGNYKGIINGILSKKKKKIVQDSSAVKCKILGNSCQLQTYKTFNANAALLPMLKNKRFQYEI